ncbi:decaprenyl-phosphate phosphoribosyltransferase [uncultured Leptotrichia sp.]|jgi:prenyltransferase, ubiA family|uniref:decaprenyl-phosphate phosphoribosyltransferase n=1 Tax=uncultured Leptotrichia sp. TaxID=159271 RepID=UPI002602F7DF|nr:decaprenyl-phosphate phosphoribosyltransferase [uncultured Leptotrichia sp.]
MIKNYIKLMRPKHYLKNGLILAPLFFSKEINILNKIIDVLFAFLAFSLISSTIYIINDTMDAEKDRQHPKKCKRPIASGQISKRNAIIFSIFLFILSLTFHYFGNRNKLFSISTIYLISYFFINLSYSLGLKNKPILDLVLLSAGFLLRVLYGGEITDVPISYWLYLIVITFSFYMGFGKRRGELEIKGDKNTREVLKKYSYEFLDKKMSIFMALTLVFYSLWTVDKKTTDVVGSDLFIWTVPLVIIIFLRYSYVVELGESDGDPVEVLLSDKVLISLVIVYILVTIIFFYKNFIF